MCFINSNIIGAIGGGYLLDATSFAWAAFVGAAMSFAVVSGEARIFVCSLALSESAWDNVRGTAHVCC